MNDCLLLIYIYSYSMVQSPTLESNWFAASQDIPRISRNPKVHYRTHKRPPPVSILGIYIYVCVCFVCVCMCVCVNTRTHTFCY